MIAVDVTAFPIALVRQTPAGTCVGVHMPDEGNRELQFAAGRVAAARAAEEAGLPPGVVGRDRAGRPLPVAGSVVSISHKGGLAVAVVAPAGGGRIGIDVETLQPARPSVAEAVLTAEELSATSRAREAERWTELLIRFSLKEATYKAIAPAEQESLGFRAVEVGRLGRGTASCTVAGQRVGEANWFWFGRYVVTTVRFPSEAGRPPALST